MKFNHDAITAILEGRKTMTRRPIKEELDGYFFMGFDKNGDAKFTKHISGCIGTTKHITPKYKIGEIVKVLRLGGYPSYENTFVDSHIRIKITNIKGERLQDISEEDCVKEGAEVACMGCDELYPNCKCTSPDYDNAKDLFRYDIWNKLPYPALYNWKSNPPVLPYEFEVL